MKKTDKTEKTAQFYYNAIKIVLLVVAALVVFLPFIMLILFGADK